MEAGGAGRGRPGHARRSASRTRVVRTEDGTGQPGDRTRFPGFETLPGVRESQRVRESNSQASRSNRLSKYGWRPRASCVQAGDEIGRDEERSPHFVLPHVHALVRAGRLERVSAAPNHDMPQRHRRGAAAGQGSQCCQRTSQERAVCFDNPVHYRGPAASEHRERQYEAEERGWTGPEVAKRAVHLPIVTRRVQLRVRLL